MSTTAQELDRFRINAFCPKDSSLDRLRVNSENLQARNLRDTIAKAAHEAVERLIEVREDDDAQLGCMLSAGIVVMPISQWQSLMDRIDHLEMRTGRGSRGVGP